LLKTVVIIGGPEIFDGAFYFRLFLTVTKICKPGKALAHETELPFGKRIAALEPAILRKKFPTAIKSGGCGRSFNDGPSHVPDKFFAGHFVGIEKKNPRMFNVTVIQRQFR